jgi:hypothetical protein
MILGCDISAEGYNNMLEVIEYFFYTFENSIGAITNPTYFFWTNSDGSDPHGLKMTMILLIWLVWFLNQWFIFMILLNFIIAIIT